MKPIHNVMLEFGCRIAQEIEARALLLYADAAFELPLYEEGKRGFDLILVTKDNHVPERFAGSSLSLNVPNVNLTRVGQIKIAVTKGIALGLFKKGDKIVCLSGVPKFGYVDSIFVIDVGKEFEILTSEYLTDLTEKVYPEVFGAILNLSIELAAQG
ncbi:MAG TPA: hypothetical protein PLB95_12910, partial [Syntrophales bacterium]|nr:hypothetical protein [Syntrophales bacterium]